MGSTISKAEHKKLLRGLELENEKRQKEHDRLIREMEIENTRKKGELDHAKGELVLRSEEMRSKYRIEAGKANLEHRHKLNELIAQIKQSNAGAEKEVLLSFMETINSIMQQNDNIHEKVIKLSQLFNNDNLPEAIKSATEKEIEKLYNAYKTPEEILVYVKQQINESQLNQDTGLKQVIDLAGEKDLITEEDKLYLTKENE